MTQPTGSTTQPTRAPWHLWVIGTCALLWYASGAITIQLAQLGMLPGLRADELMYYAAKPMWLVILTAIGTYGSLVASVLLLFRHRAAAAMFAVALLAILIADVAELADGTSRALANRGAAIVTVLVVCIGIAMLLYARAMQRRVRATA